MLAPALLHALVLLPAPPRRAPKIAHRAHSTAAHGGEPELPIAGGAPSPSHVLATPIDVIKTRQQTMSSYRSLSFKHAFQRCYREEGGRALLGLGPTLTGYFFEGALKFGAYEALKKPALALLGAIVGAGPAASLGPLSAAIAGGAIASVVLAPAEATRIRQVSDPAYAGLGTLAATAKLYGAERAAGLFRGVPATLIKQLPYTAAKERRVRRSDGRGALRVARGRAGRRRAADAALDGDVPRRARRRLPGDPRVAARRRHPVGGEPHQPERLPRPLRRRSVQAARRRRARARPPRALAHTGVIVTVQLISRRAQAQVGSAMSLVIASNFHDTHDTHLDLYFTPGCQAHRAGQACPTGRSRRCAGSGPPR